MDPDVKEKWVAALRSGKYKKGKGVLRNGTRFCCLGVLCDIRDDVEWTPQNEAKMVRGAKTEDTYPPPTLLKKIHLGKKDVDYLVNLNDCRMRTFRDISDWIEENL